MTATTQRPRVGDLEPIAPKAYAYGNLFVSAYAVKLGAPLHPLLIFGHDATDTAMFFANSSTLSALAVTTEAAIDEAVREHTLLGIFAMSPPERAGGAQQAIHHFKEIHGGLNLCLYGAWSHDPETAVRRAVDAGANGVILPEVDAEEMFQYIFALLQAIGEEKKLPETESDILQHLRVAFPNSPFWTAPAETIEEHY